MHVYEIKEYYLFYVAHWIFKGSQLLKAIIQQNPAVAGGWGIPER